MASTCPQSLCAGVVWLEIRFLRYLILCGWFLPPRSSSFLLLQGKNSPEKAFMRQAIVLRLRQYKVHTA